VSNANQTSKFLQMFIQPKYTYFQRKKGFGKPFMRYLYRQTLLPVAGLSSS